MASDLKSLNLNCNKQNDIANGEENLNFSRFLQRDSLQDPENKGVEKPSERIQELESLITTKDKHINYLQKQLSNQRAVCQKLEIEMQV